MRVIHFFIDICSDKYNTALNKDGAKANESIWEVEFAGNRSTDVRAEGRIGNIIGIQGKDLSSKASITGKGDPGYPERKSGYGLCHAIPSVPVGKCHAAAKKAGTFTVGV